MAIPFERAIPQIHIRFQGRSYQLPASELDVSARSSDQEIKRALAQHFDVAVAKFAAYVIERHENGNMTVRPEAVFG